MSSWFSQGAVDTGIAFAADAVGLLNQRIAESEDPEERRKYIAKWKTEAKAAIKKLSDEAKKNYAEFKNLVKSYDTKYLDSPINSEALMELKRILTNARKAEDNEKRSGQYKVVLMIKDLATFFGVEKSEFDNITNAINDCFLKLQAEYQSFQKFGCETFEKIKNDVEPDDKGKTIKSLREFSANLSRRQGEISGKMRSHIQTLKSVVGQYTVKKMNEMDYAFTKIQQEVKAEIDKQAKSSPEGAPTSEAVAKMTTDKFIVTIPNTLIYFKILASIAGVRSNSVPAINPEKKEQYGKYGYGLFAKICHTIDQHITALIRNFNTTLDGILKDKIASDGDIKTLTWK